MIISPGAFFHFLKILIFWVVSGVKGQKKAQHEKWKLHSSRVVSQEQCRIWLWFLVNLCKMISPGVFYVFSNLIFRVVEGIKGQKSVQNEKKFCLLRNHTSSDCHLWYTCVKWCYLQGFFFIFSKFCFFRLLGG